MILIKKIKKLMAFSTGLFLLSAIFTACDVAWFADLDESFTEYCNSKFNFYSSTLEENENAKVTTASYKIGEETNASSFPYSDFDNYVVGYHVEYFKYYRDSQTLDTNIPSNITVSEDDGRVVEVYVNTNSYDFYAVWAPNTNTKYTVQHFFQNPSTDSYDLNAELTQTLEGTSDTQTAATALEIPGYAAKDFEQVNINPDGSACVTIYYDVVKSDSGNSGTGGSDTGDSGDSGSGDTGSGDSGSGDSGSSDTGTSYDLDISVDVGGE